jgi:cyclase
VLEWARRAVDLGAGEILLTSVDREGTGKGFDVELVRAVSEAVSVPVIASGGLGSVSHMVEVVREGRADAVAAAKALHYNALSIEQLRRAALQEGVHVRQP